MFPIQFYSTLLKRPKRHFVHTVKWLFIFNSIHSDEYCTVPLFIHHWHTILPVELFITLKHWWCEVYCIEMCLLLGHVLRWLAFEVTRFVLCQRFTCIEHEMFKLCCFLLWNVLRSSSKKLDNLIKFSLVSNLYLIYIRKTQEGFNKH